MLVLRLSAGLALSAVSVSAACISLASSKMCPAFNGSYVSTTRIDHFPFLAFVSNVNDFDSKFATFVTDSYVQSKYQNTLGCGGLNLTDTSNLYARYTTSVLCNAMVQESLGECINESGGNRPNPLCADTCAQFAISEQVIVSDPQTCNSSRTDKNDQIRSDFTICALPNDSLSGSCISGSENENENCGYNKNLPSLCSYCASGSPNATDTCCYNVDLTLCEGVRLPPTASLPPLFTTTVTATPSNTAVPSNRLSGGAIAGIAIGTIAALALLALLALCLVRRRKRRAQSINSFNQPSPRRRTLENGQMTYHPTGSAGNRGDGYEALPSGRIARMSALEHNNNTSSETGDTPRHHRGLFTSSSPNEKALQPPPRGHRNGSVSSSSMLDPMSSPLSDNRGNGVSSPGYNDSSQSEQLPTFKDYYSKDYIKNGDDVSTLWAYAPRAKDEFELERGDMLRVIGIWDDGWATGVRISGRAEDYMQRRQQRDSGLSAQTDNDHNDSSPLGNDVRAFPLVCVCLPEYWQSTVDQENASGFPEEGLRQSSDELNEKSSSSPERRVDAKSSSRFNDDLHVDKSKR